MTHQEVHNVLLWRDLGLVRHSRELRQQVLLPVHPLQVLVNLSQSLLSQLASCRTDTSLSSLLSDVEELRVSHRDELLEFLDLAVVGLDLVLDAGDLLLVDGS